MARGKFKSERQRRWMWANVKSAAHKWAHGMTTTKADWRGAHRLKAKRGRRSR